jgi:hypothetical protein
MQFTTTKADAGQRRSFVVAMDAQGVLPCTFPVFGTTNGYLFTLWFALVLLPAVAARHPGGCNIILDNASIHLPLLLLWLVASFYPSIFVIFLPPYSPELNPVRARAAAAVQVAHAALTRTHRTRNRSSCSSRGSSSRSDEELASRPRRSWPPCMRVRAAARRANGTR